MKFFSSDKRLQEIFFQNHPPPPPPQELNGRPLMLLQWINEITWHSRVYTTIQSYSNSLFR